jgi:glucan phosphoethanolaminetransferase (alkaline phosphatase superfamily)
MNRAKKCPLRFCFAKHDIFYLFFVFHFISFHFISFMRSYLHRARIITLISAKITYFMFTYFIIIAPITLLNTYFHKSSLQRNAIHIHIFSYYHRATLIMIPYFHICTYFYKVINNLARDYLSFCAHHHIRDT